IHLKTRVIDDGILVYLLKFLSMKMTYIHVPVCVFTHTYICIMTFWHCFGVFNVQNGGINMQIFLFYLFIF
uniref:Uncharacterized protein n=1 Tax=Spermophilus dauricus TaxID=99837 RepID=A0A8C9QVZ0_SPEDA